MKKKNLRLLIGLAALVIVVLVNALTGLLPASVSRLDATTGSLMTPSAALDAAVQAVDQPLTIYHVANRGKEDELLSALLQRLEEKNQQITVRQLVPGTAGDDIVTRYAPEGLTDNSLIVVSPLRAYVIKYSSLVQITYNQNYLYYYGQYVPETQEYYADAMLTFALNYTTHTRMPVVYQLTGHGEGALASLASDQLAQRYMALESLNLESAGQVPEDAQLLVINAPQTDISAQESVALLTYLKQGGRLLLTTAYSASELPNLSDVMKYYGLVSVPGLVQDPAAGYHYADANAAYNYYLKPALNESDALSGMLQAKLCLPQSHALTTGTITREGLKVEALAQTSESAYRKVDIAKVATLDQEEGDPVGVHTLIASASEGETRLAWIANAQTFSDNSISISGGANAQLLTELMRWMVGELPQPQAMQGVNLLLNPLDTTLPNTNVVRGLVIALPVLALLLGLIACASRGKKKK